MKFSEDFWVSAQNSHDFLKVSHWLEYSIFEHCCELVLNTCQKNCDVQRVQFQLLSQILIKTELVKSVNELRVTYHSKNTGFDLHLYKITSFFSR